MWIMTMFVSFLLLMSSAQAATSNLIVKVRGNDSGPGIADADVRVSGAASANARTNANGVATLQDLARGNVTIHVSAHGWRDGQAAVRLKQSVEELSIELDPWQTRLIINVVGKDDGVQKPVPQCNVKLTLADGTTKERTSDANGTVVMDRVPRGSVRIRVIATGWRTSIGEQMLESDKQTVRVVLEKQLPPQPEGG